MIIFGYKGQEARGGKLRKLNNEMLSSSLYVVSMIDLRNMRWARYVVRIECKKNKEGLLCCPKGHLLGFSFVFVINNII
jgi:hypothetical protein